MAKTKGLTRKATLTSTGVAGAEQPDLSASLEPLDTYRSPFDRSPKELPLNLPPQVQVELGHGWEHRNQMAFEKLASKRQGDEQWLLWRGHYPEAFYAAEVEGVAPAEGRTTLEVITRLIREALRAYPNERWAVLEVGAMAGLDLRRLALELEDDVAAGRLVLVGTNLGFTPPEVQADAGGGLRPSFEPSYGREENPLTQDELALMARTQGRVHFHVAHARELARVTRAHGITSALVLMHSVAQHIDTPEVDLVHVGLAAGARGLVMMYPDYGLRGSPSAPGEVADRNLAGLGLTDASGEFSEPVAWRVLGREGSPLWAAL